MKTFFTVFLVCCLINAIVTPILIDSIYHSTVAFITLPAILPAVLFTLLLRHSLRLEELEEQIKQLQNDNKIPDGKE